MRLGETVAATRRALQPPHPVAGALQLSIQSLVGHCLRKHRITRKLIGRRVARIVIFEVVDVTFHLVEAALEVAGAAVGPIQNS